MAFKPKSKFKKKDDRGGRGLFKRRKFCRFTRSTFSSEIAANMSNWWPFLVPGPSMLSSESTKQRLGNSAYCPVTAWYVASIFRLAT